MDTLNFLWLAGIYGDSQDLRHLGEFNVLRHYWGEYIGTIDIKYMIAHGSPRSLDFVVKNNTPAFNLLVKAMNGRQHIHTAIFTYEKNNGGRSGGVRGRLVMREASIISMTGDFDPISKSLDNLITLNFDRLEF